MAHITLYMMIGIPGSGKSTWRKAYLSDAIIVSPDDILEEKYNYEWTPQRAGQAWRECYRRIGALVHEAALDDSDRAIEVVFDAVFPTPQDRNALLNICKGMGVKVVAVYFAIPLDTCKARNDLRPSNRKVPYKQLENFERRMTPPADYEGFDEVIFVTPKDQI